MSPQYHVRAKGKGLGGILCKLESLKASLNQSIEATHGARSQSFFEGLHTEGVQVAILLFLGVPGSRVTLEIWIPIIYTCTALSLLQNVHSKV